MFDVCLVIKNIAQRESIKTYDSGDNRCSWFAYFAFGDKRENE